MAEYEPGQRLKVKLNLDVGSATSSHEIDLGLEIIHPYKPFTMSVVCQVRVVSSSSPALSGSLPEILLIKLFDRRFQNNSREDYDEGRPWTPEKEAAYQMYLPHAPKKRSKWWHPQFASEEKYRNEGEMEEFIDRGCQDFFHNECRAYNDMLAIQGTHIPKLYGTFIRQIPLLSSSDSQSSPATVQYCAKGLLLEYIPSVTLKAFLQDAIKQHPLPYDTISTICDQAVALVDRLEDFNVLNDDVQIWNILVAKEDDQDTTRSTTSVSDHPSHMFRCVAIDFGNSRLRHSDETEEQWRRAKQDQDEMAAIGRMAESQMRKWAEAEGIKIDTERLWSYQGNRRWYRVLNEEEQKAYETEVRWGLYASEEEDLEGVDCKQASRRLHDMPQPPPID